MRIVYWAKLQLAKKLTIERLGAVPGIELVIVERLPELLEALPGAAGLVLADAPEPEARQIVDCLKGPAASVRWMHFLSAGQDGFTAAGIPAGIVVTTPDGSVSPTVAEHAMALLLALARRIPEIAAATARGTWDRSMSAHTTSLEGQVLAIVGFGSIGREIARRARGFGMRLVAVTRSPKPDPLVDEAVPLNRLHDVLRAADVVAMSIALAAETYHLIDAKAFAAMKPGAILINVSRGGVVDSIALREALQSGRLGGAGLDVTEPEPLPDGDPLWSSPNIIISGHFAGGGSLKSQERLANSAAENLKRFLAEELTPDRVADRVAG